MYFASYLLAVPALILSVEGILICTYLYCAQVKVQNCPIVIRYGMLFVCRIVSYSSIFASLAAVPLLCWNGTIRSIDLNCLISNFMV